MRLKIQTAAGKDEDPLAALIESCSPPDFSSQASTQS